MKPQNKWLGPPSPVGAFFDERFPFALFAAAVAGSVLLHVSVAMVLPDEFSSGEPERERPREYELLLEPKERTLPERFVLTNPEVPQNEPEDTPHFASRDQQAAQEAPSEAENPEDALRVEGEDLSAVNIVSGDPFPEFPLLPPDAEAEPPSGEETPVLAQRRPIPGFEELEPESEEGASMRDNEEDDPDRDESRVIGLNVPEDAESEREDPAPATTAQRSQPMERPRLPQGFSGPLREQRGSAPREGRIGIDANRTEFGDYLTRMVEAIERQWHRLAHETWSHHTAAQVRIRFMLDSSGGINEAEVVETTAGIIGTMICMDAIEARAPYGPWTNDMVEILGDEQTITFTFHYR